MRSPLALFTIATVLGFAWVGHSATPEQADGDKDDSIGGIVYSRSPDDTDEDGVLNNEDVCPITPSPFGVHVDGRPKGDLDEDCDVDLNDFATFAGNYTGIVPPAGACCYPDEACAMEIEYDCGGVWLGEGITCDPNPCEKPDMVLVPAGSFPYQDTSEPGEWVYVDTFMIDTTEVTNQAYCQFLNSTDPTAQHWHPGMEIDRYGDLGSYTYAVQAGRDNYPIVYTTFYDAEAFAAWRSSVDGVTYRLPTHHEWEKAAAWDPVETYYYTYAFHADTISCPRCNYFNCTIGAMPVGSYDGTGGFEDAQSYYGCYDMSGNVREWTSEVSGPNRVIRGGSWQSTGTACECAYRYDLAPSYREDNIGFRIVKELD